MGFKPWMAWAGLLLGAASLAGCQNSPAPVPANAPPPTASNWTNRQGISPGAMVNPTASANAPNYAANGGPVATNATLAGNMTSGTAWTNNTNANVNNGWNNGAPMRPMDGTAFNNNGMAQPAAGYSQNMQNNGVQQTSWNQTAQPAQGSSPAPVWPVTNVGDNGGSGMNNGPANGYQPNMPPPINSGFNQGNMAAPANSGYNQGNMAAPANSTYNTTYPQMPFNRGQ